MPPRRTFSSTENITLTLPPFTWVVKWLLSINLIAFIALRLLSLSEVTLPAAAFVFRLFALTPHDLLHGWLWQLVTYPFLERNVLSLLFNLLGIWILGSIVEGIFGAVRFLRYYLYCAIAAGVATTAIAYFAPQPYNTAFMGLPLAGPNGALNGLLVALGVLMGETEFWMLPFPFRIKVKYLVWITIVFYTLMSLDGPGGFINMGQLGGLFFGYFYIKYTHLRRTRPALAVGRGLSDRIARPAARAPFYARWRDSYYRWKRRRAARKFEVYMRKHNREVYFDKEGHYIDPESSPSPQSDAPHDPQSPEDRGGKPWIN